jgi:ribosomal subunit interface protein
MGRAKEEAAMAELVLKSRGVQITDHVRKIAGERLAKLDGPRRPSVTRLEVEIVEEPTPRIGGGHRVHLTCVTPHKTFRSEAFGATIDAALDLAVERLDRQVDTYRSKLESRTTRTGSHTIPTATPE